MWTLLSLGCIILVIAFLELPKYIKKKKSQDAPIQVYRAVYVRTTNLTSNAVGPQSKSGDPFVRKVDNDPILWFQLADSGKSVHYECAQHIAVKMPSEGTEGALEVKGLLFRSFTWDGGKLVLDENDTTPQSVFLQS